MHDSIPSVHIVGSRSFGGSEHFYVRLLKILKNSGQSVLAINRPETPVAKALAEDGIKQIHLPLANGWDLWSPWRADGQNQLRPAGKPHRHARCNERSTLFRSSS